MKVILPSGVIGCDTASPFVDIWKKKKKNGWGGRIFLGRTGASSPSAALNEIRADDMMGDVPGSVASGQRVARHLWLWPRSGPLSSGFHTSTVFPWWPNAFLCSEWKCFLIHFSYFSENALQFASARSPFHKRLVNLMTQGALTAAHGLIWGSGWFMTSLIHPLEAEPQHSNC